MRTLTVGIKKMIGGNLESLMNAFTNGDGGHDDNELRPAILRVESEHALYVAISLAGTGLHFHVEVDLAGLRRDEMRGAGQVLAVLHRLHVFQQLAQWVGEIGIGKAIDTEVDEFLTGGILT